MTHEPHAVLATAAGRTMSLKRVDARGRVAGLLLSMTVRQHFRNDTDETLEGVCTFPLAWGAVLLGLSAELAGRRLDGAVLARPEADARYEEAVAAGDAPIRLRKGPDGLFTVDLGNLKPGETADIELRYAQPLRVEQGRVRLSVPTTIAPRCGDMAAQPGMRPHDTTAASLSADYGFTLSLDLDATAAAGPIESPTHAIAVAARPDGGARVSIDGRAWLDRDFVLAFAGGAQAMGTARALRAPDGAGCVVMASFCPAIDGGDRAALDLKLLVDCSGSMAGDSIASARRGLERVLAALRPADRVSFSRFGSTVRHVLDALQPADGPTLERLHREVGATDATMGGTELNAALVSTFSLRGARTGSKADVLLVTDGQVADIEPVVAAARASGQRIFAVGVGTAPAESLLRTLAESTGGACERVAPGESIEGAIERTFARLRVPRVSGVSIDWGTAPSWATETPLQRFDGDTLHVFAGFDAPSAPVAPRLLFTVETRTGRGRERVASTSGWALAATVEEAAGAAGGGDADPSKRPAGPIAAGDASVVAEASAFASRDADEVVAAGGAEVEARNDRAGLADASPAAVLPRLAAARRIEALARRRPVRRRGTVPAEGRDEIRALALRYRLVTEETDLFLVHVRADAERTDGLPTLERTAQMLAAGWGGTGSVTSARDIGVLYSLGAASSSDRDALGLTDALFDDIAPQFTRRSPRTAAPAAPFPRARPEGRIPPHRLLALVRRHLGDRDDLAALLDALRGAEFPASARTLLDALRIDLGLTAYEALLARLWGLAVGLGEGDLPGAGALGRMHAHLCATVPAARLDEVRAALRRHAGGAGLDAW